MAAVSVTSANTNNFGTRNGHVLIRNSSGIPYIVVNDSTDGGIEVWKGNSATPTSFSEQDSTNNPQLVDYRDGPAAAIDSNGIIHIAYADTATVGNKTFEIRYATFNTSTDLFVINESVIATSSGGPTSVRLDIAVDASNLPHIVYSENVSNMGTDYSTVYYINRTSGSWSSRVEVEGQANTVQAKSGGITIGSDNRPQISYYIVSTSIKAAIGNLNNATSFTLQVIDSTSISNFCTDIAVDSSGNTWVCYVRSSNVYIVKHNVGDSWATWQTPTTNSTAYGGESSYTGPAISADGSDIYTFFEDSSNDIVYESYISSSWSGPTTLETGTYNNAKSRWAFWANYDSAGAVQVAKQYYFDSSDSGPTDPGGVWTNATNIDDGNSSTEASTTNTSGSKSSNYLETNGTNAPASGDSIINVYCFVQNSTVRGSCVKLSTPTGGWTWTKIQGLTSRTWRSDIITQNIHTEIYESGDAGGTGLGTSSISTSTGTASKINIIVLTGTETNADLDYAFVDETASTDILWNVLSLGGGTTTNSDTINSNSFINKTNSGTIPSNSRIQKTFSDNILSDANILLNKSSTIVLNSFINTTMTDTLLSNSIIQDTFSDSVTSDANIQLQQTDSLVSDSVINKNLSDAILSNSIIQKTLSDTITSDSNILLQNMETILSDSVINKTLSDTLVSNSVIQNTLSDVLTSDSKILRTITKTINSNSIIQKTQTDNLISNSYINKTFSGTITSDSEIQKLFSGAIISDSIIQTTNSDILLSDGVINITSSDNILSDSVISDTFSDNLISDSVIVGGGLTDTITSDSIIQQTKTDTLLSHTRIVNRHQGGSTTVTYYFDGSDVPATDSNNVWNNETNTDDGSTSTYADTSTGGGFTLNYIAIQGTNAPSTGPNITQVRVRVFGGTSDTTNATEARIYIDGRSEILGTATTLSLGADVYDWSPYVTLSTPTSGWTWTVLQGLEARIRFRDNGPGGTSRAYLVELEVTIAGIHADAEIIAATSTAYLSSDSNIQGTISGTLNSDSIISITSSNTLLSDSVIQQTLSDTLLSDSLISTTSSDTILSDSVIQSNDSDSIVSDSYIQNVVSGMITSSGFITSGSSKNILSSSVIFKSGLSDTIQSDSVIQTSGLDTILSDSYIATSNSDMIVSNSNISTGLSGILTSDSSILSTVSNSIQSDASIAVILSDSLTSDSVLSTASTSGTIRSDLVIFKADLSDVILSNAQILDAAVTRIIYASNKPKVLLGNSGRVKPKVHPDR